MSERTQAHLLIGDEAEVATILLGAHELFAQNEEAPLWGCVYDEGCLWRSDANGVWRPIDDSEVVRMVMGFSGMPKPTQDGGEAPLKVGIGFARGVLGLVEAASAMPGFFAEGAWGIAFRKTFLRIDVQGEAALEPLTPQHRCRFALDFEYDESTPVPTAFMTFVTQLWGDDLEQTTLLLEWIGYLLSGRTDFQKILLMIGPPRSGKGTILRLLKSLFGRGACAFKVTDLHEKWTTQTMVGKVVAYDPDLRRSSINEGESQAVEKLLSISGEDDVPIQKKFGQLGHTKIGARLILCTNPPFRMSDVGGALSTRLLILKFSESFLGKEDLGLGDRLSAELPGIVKICVIALRALAKRGRFVEPASSCETRVTIQRGETPILAFFDDRCLVEKDALDLETPCGDLYAEFGKWCELTGHRRPSDTTFAETLQRIGIVRVRLSGDSRKRIYRGVKLLPPEGRIGAPKFQVVK